LQYYIQPIIEAANRSKGTKSKPAELRLREGYQEGSYFQRLDRSRCSSKEQTKMDACKDQQAECKESRRRAAG